MTPNDSIDPTIPPTLYPAEFHVSIIGDMREGLEQALADVLKNYKVITPLYAGIHAPNKKYHSWRTTVEVATSEELHALDAALRAVPGVKMLV